MSSSAALQPEPAPVAACTVSRDVSNFDLLISDMETAMGESWGDLSFSDALAYLDQPEAGALEFLALALDETDEDRIDLILDLVAEASDRGIRIILIASSVSPGTLHRLMRSGASEFLPYPLPEGALREALEKIRRPSPPAIPATAPQGAIPTYAGDQPAGTLLAVHGLAGGVGATTFAVNLAWELASPDATRVALRVCLLDFDLQTGSVATYLDLTRRDIVSEILSDPETLDAETLTQAIQIFGERVSVLTAPPDILPFDIVGPDGVGKIIEIARRQFDVVLIDMPTTLIAWTETVLRASDIYFALLELDMRSAQNALRFVRLLKSEDLPLGKLRFAMNRAPRFTDLQGRSRIKRMADSLDIDIELLLPDGQKQVTQAGDNGHPLAQSAAKNPLRREIAKLAGSLRDLIAKETAAN
ncbi:AAA family ATPase [Tropicimonas sp.]|uniref:AAA family ATPase n=1 Tax=Tropicimonas sp. TaxID=2067044 RepID=UPI003A85A0B7